MAHVITLIPGDGIGPEVTEAVVRIFHVAGLEIEWERYDAGVMAFKRFNQSLLLAQRLAVAFEKPVEEALVRLRFTGTQASSVSAEQRRRNVEGAFAVRPGANITSRTILLIDDVATTCATLDACAKVLLEAGARDVYGLTIARED